MFSPIQDRKQLVDEATSPLQLSQAEIDTSFVEPPVKPKKVVKKIEVEEEPEDQEIYAVSQSVGDASQFPAPKSGFGITPLSRVEKARLLNAGFTQIFDEDGHRPVVVGTSIKGSDGTRVDFSAEQKDLRYNDVTLTFMGLTFNAGLFNHFGGAF